MAMETVLTYKAAGVDIDAGEALVKRIKPSVERTFRPEVMGSLGGFGGLCRIPAGYREPVLVSGTDGVGTKIKLAIENDAHDTIGIDLVAMCANDVLVQGAEPLFFLDYFVTPRLDVDVAARVVTGIARGCELAGAALIGGETAEHPGMHQSGEYDLAGFCVGVVEADAIIDGRSIVASDVVIGLASSGPHSNGFSLIRKALDRDRGSADTIVDGKRLIERLLEPTRIYARPVLAARPQVTLKGLAHITGGGLTENIPRVLPDGLGAILDRASWPRYPIFEWLADSGVPAPELYRTFNCGIGMVIVTAAADADRTVQIFTELGETAAIIGTVVEDEREAVRIV